MTENEYKKQIIPILKFLLPTLTNSETKAAEYLLEEPAEVANLSLVEFAERSGSSQASIIRLCKRIGVSGFAQMKTFLAVQLVEKDSNGYMMDNLPGGKSDGTIAPVIKRVFETNIQTLADTLALYSDEYEKAFDAILQTKRLCFFAMGDAMYPCQSADYKFRKLGYISHADSDSDMQIINANNLKPGDVAIAVSHTGKTRQVVAAMKIAKKRGATTICITKYEKSELIKCCDIKIFTATSDIKIGKEIAARRVAEQAILEALFLGVMEKTAPASEKRINEISSGMKINKI